MADLGQAPLRVFIIGPMSKDRTDPQGLRLFDHLPAIGQGLDSAVARLRAAHEAVHPEAPLRPVVVQHPPGGGVGNIIAEVFPKLFHCDVAVADISTLSPNVFFELALLHANGTPVILLTTENKNTFYETGQNYFNLTAFEPAEIESALLGDGFGARIAAAPAGYRAAPLYRVLYEPTRAHGANPVTDYFGGVHLVNVAAATGIATGQFYNFLRFVLRDGGVFRHTDFKKLILIRPRRIKDVDDCVRRLETTFGIQKFTKDASGADVPVLDRQGEPVFQLNEKVYIDDDHPRGKYFFKFIGDYIVDYPTPISSLSVSPQIERMRDFVRSDDGDTIDESEVAFERRLIEVYFETLRALAENRANTCDWGRVRVMTIDELIDFGPLQPFRRASA